MKEFTQWTLNIGDGVVGKDNDGQEEVWIVEYMLNKDVCNPIKSIVGFLYPSFLSEIKIPKLATIFINVLSWHP